MVEPAPASPQAATDGPSLPVHGTSPEYLDYIHDQLQRSRTVADHAAVLKNRAAARIASPPTDPSQPHTVERMLDEQAFYPAHDKRTESPDYAKVHHQLTLVDDKHCLVCGVQYSTLGDPTGNPFGAKQMETHHHTIEWALANAVDPAKFNLHIRPGLLHQAERRKTEASYAQLNPAYKAFDDSYQTDMDLDTIRAWVDHAADNLWVLCDIHHRHKYVGIHAITFPIWGPQDVVDDAILTQQIGLAKSTTATV